MAQNALERALAAGNIVQVKCALADPRCRPTSRHLEAAYNMGRWDLVELLLDHPQCQLRDSHLPMLERHTAINIVVASGRVALVEKLATHPNFMVHHGHYMISNIAIKRGEAEIVRYMYDNYTFAANLLAEAHDAIAAGSIAIFEFIAGRAPEGALRENYWLLGEQAVRTGNVEMMRSVIAHARPRGSVVHALMLQVIVQPDRLEMLKCVLSYPAITPDVMSALLAAAVEAGNNEAADLLRDEIDARAGHVRDSILAALHARLGPLAAHTTYPFIHTTRAPALQPRFAAAVRAALDTP